MSTRHLCFVRACARVVIIASCVVASVVAAAACTFGAGFDADAFVRCGADGSCPETSTCIAALQRCVPAESDCVVGRGSDLTAAADGTSCGDGSICLQGLCVAARCGDGFRGDGEECDDGSGNSDTAPDACRSNCVRAFCGDDVIDDGEDCDDGADNSGVAPDACRTDCTLPRCGDGVRDNGEACDDGNTDSGDGCRGTCDKVEACGDGIVDDGEACDDENDNDLDLCGDCRSYAWTPEVVLGLGADGGDPQQLQVGPLAVAVDRSGNIFVADLLSSSVYRLDAVEQKVTRLAGTGTATSVATQRAGGVRATEVNTTAVFSMHVSAAGDLFLADTDESTVRRIDGVTGRVTRVAGNGTNEVGRDGLPATLAAIGDPRDIATDGEGNLLIADAVGELLRRVDRDTGIITTIAGTGEAGSDGDGGDPLRARINPRSIDVDAAGNVYLLEEASVLRRLVVDPSNRQRFLRIERIGVPPRRDDSLETIAVTASGDHVYATNRGQDAIVDFDLVRGTKERIAGTGTPGFNGDGPGAAVQLNAVTDIVIQNDDNLIIADTQNGRVRRLSRGADGAWTVTTLIGGGLAGLVDVPAYLAPRLLQVGGGGIGLHLRPDCVDKVDVVLAQADLHQIFLKDACNGAFRLMAGTGERGSSGDGGPALAATFDEPRGAAVDALGNIYVADPAAHVVRRIGADGIVTRVAGIAGEPGLEGDGGAARDAKLRRPTGVAVDDRGRIVIADAGNNRLRRIEPGTNVITTLLGGPGGAPLAEPIAVSFVPGSLLFNGASGGLLLFAERTGHRVRAYLDVVIPNVPQALLPVQTITLAGSDLGEEGYLDDEDGLVARFSHPRALGGFVGESCPTGCVFVIDGIDRVRRLTLRLVPGLRPTIASGVTTELGGADASDDGPFASARLLGPSALAPFGPDAALVVDRASGRLRRINFAAERVDTVAGLPEGTNVGAEPTSARLARPFVDPAGIVVDETAAPAIIYVAERGADVIRRVTVVDRADPSTWTTEVACGRPGASGHVDGACVDARFDGPAGLALQAERGLLFVADQDNHVVRRVDLATGNVQTIAGQVGLRGAFVDDGVRAIDALLDTPTGLAVVDGALFVADAGVHRVVRIDDALADDLTVPTVHPVLGDGIAASSGDGRPAAFFTVDTPEGIATDLAGNLFVTSQQALRFVGSADDLADGADLVANVYGAPPRARFPEPVTRCLSGVTTMPGGDVLTVDGCIGLLLRLQRRELAAPGP